MDIITVAIADSDEVKRTACEYLLRYEEDIQVIGQAATMKEVVGTAITLKPRVILCQFNLAATAGFSLLQMLRGEPAGPAVLLLTDRWAQEDKILQALGMGARGYLSLDGGSGQLARAIRSISQGEAWVPRQTLGRYLDRAARACWG